MQRCLLLCSRARSVRISTWLGELSPRERAFTCLASLSHFTRRCLACRARRAAGPSYRLWAFCRRSQHETSLIHLTRCLRTLGAREGLLHGQSKLSHSHVMLRPIYILRPSGAFCLRQNAHCPEGRAARGRPGVPRQEFLRRRHAV